MAGISSNTRSVNRSTQRRPTPLCARERSGQRGKQRHIPDWIDRRPDVAKSLLILINRGDMGKWALSFQTTADQWRDKATVGNAHRVEWS